MKAHGCVFGAPVVLVLALLVNGCGPGQLLGGDTSPGESAREHQWDAAVHPDVVDHLADPKPDAGIGGADGGNADARANPDGYVGGKDGSPPELDSRATRDTNDHDTNDHDTNDHDGGHVVNKTWAIVFSHIGPRLPDELVSYACDREVPQVEAWMAKQAARYGVSVPYGSIECLDGQFALPASVLDEEGKIDFLAAFDYLKGQVSGLSTAKYVTVISTASDYKGGSARTMSDVLDVFPVKLTFVDDLTLAYPGTDDGEWALTFAHELMHKHGALDKYNTTPETACLRNRLTGQYYSGYDIMCHRLPLSEQGLYTMTPFDQCRVTQDTALEMSWEPYPSSTDRVHLLHPTGGETWYAGQWAEFKFTTNGLKSEVIDVYLLKDGQAVDQWLLPHCWENTPHQHRWTYSVPETIKAGDDYKLRLCDGEHPSVCAESAQPFSIKQ